MSGGLPRTEADPYALDAAWLRRSFDRASSSYDAAAVLQREVRGILLERLDLTSLTPRVVLDAGAGTGAGSRALQQRYPRSLVVALDSSPGMLKAAAQHRPWWRGIGRAFARVCADAGQLPLKDASVDLIFSNFLLPWNDPDALFAEFRRVLAPRGLLSFTGFGPDTLKELRAAWAAVDGHTRVHRFIDMHDAGDALVRAGFAAPVLDVERYTLKYTDVRGLAADLKAQGARNATAGRAKALTGPRKFAAMQAAYEHERREGRLPATYEVVFGQAWAPVGKAAGSGGTTHVALDAVRGQLPTRRSR